MARFYTYGEVPMAAEEEFDSLPNDYFSGPLDSYYSAEQVFSPALQDYSSLYSEQIRQEEESRQAELNRLAQAEQSRQAAEAEQARKAAQEAQQVRESTPQGPLSDLTPEEQELLRQFPNADINQIRQMAQYAPQNPEQVAAGQRFMAMMDLMDPAALEGIAGTSFADPNAAASAQIRPDTRAGLGSAGSWYEEGMLDAAKKGASDPTQGIWSEGYRQLLELDPEGTQQQIQQKRERDLAAIAKIEADYNVMKPISDLLKANRFKEAFDVAKQNGVVNKLMDTNTLRELRPAFTQQEMREFFAAVPSDYAGGEFDYKPDVGVYQSMDPYGTGRLMESGYPDPTAAFKRKDDKTADYLLAVAAAAMLAAGLPPIGAAPAASGTAAGTTAAAAPAAAIAPAAAAASPLQTFTIATGGGGLGGGTLAGTAGALGAGAAMTGGAATPTATAATPSVPSPLEEVVVQSLRKPVIDYTYPLLASTSLNAGISDIPTDIFGQVEAPVEQVPTEQTPSPEEEIVVTTKPYPVVKPVVIAPAIAGAGVLGQTLGEQIGYKAPGIETTPVESQGLPEVVVKATKPPALDISDVALGLGGAGALTQGFTQPKVDPFTGEPKETAKTVEEADKIQGALKSDAPIPGTGLMDKFKSALGTAEDIAKILKLLGGLGAVSSARKTTPKPVVPSAPSTGGALPAYTYNRAQLSPDIDYYTYGTRPEVKFFDYGTQAAPSGFVKQPTFASGGLMGADEGESTEQRYYDGPGSGRDDLIPALLSDGEYVMDAETLALLGDGSTKEGARRMDQFRANIRKHKGRALSRGRISPNAKSPDKYMGGGLT